MGRPATVIVLSEAEKAELIRRVKQRKGAQDACVRAQIIQACAEGESGNFIAQRLSARTWSRDGVRAFQNGDWLV